MGNILLSHHGLLDQLLPEDQSLVAPLEALLDDGRGHADDTAGHHEALVVEVAHDDDEALVLLAQQMVDGDLGVLELHERRAGGGRVGRLDLLGLNAVVPGHQDDREALFGPAGDHEVVGEHAVSDPLPGEGGALVSTLTCVAMVGLEDTYLVPLMM